VDDIVLIAPTVTAMRKLLSICGLAESMQLNIVFLSMPLNPLNVLNSFLCEYHFTVNDKPIELVQSF